VERVCPRGRDRAIPLLERAFALCHATDHHPWSAELAAGLGYAYARAGRFDNAAPVLEATLAEATATDLHFAYARQHARVAEALSLASSLGMRPLVAHCHLGFSKLYQRTRRGSRADEHRASAMAMYREMGMRYWLEQAEREPTTPA
jgi:hypothetical protein